MKEKIPVAVCSRSFSKNERLRQELLSRFQNVTFNDQGLSLAGDRLIEYLKGHERAIVALEVIDDYVLSHLPELKVIAKYGVGLDGLDLKSMQKYGVQLGHTGGVNKRSVAELTLAFAITLLRGIHIANQEVRSGIWRQYIGRDLSSVTFGIVGAGHVGKEVVRLLQPFGTKVLAHDLLHFEDFYKSYQVEAASLERVLSESDIVSLHVPLTEGTRNMMNATRLKMLKQDAFLINTSRGHIVDEVTLKELLKAGRLRAAAMDVFAQEPPTDRELLELPNFLCTPHIGGSSQEAIMAMGRAAIEGLSHYRPISTVIDGPLG